MLIIFILKASCILGDNIDLISIICVQSQLYRFENNHLNPFSFKNWVTLKFRYLIYIYAWMQGILEYHCQSIPFIVFVFKYDSPVIHYGILISKNNK